MDWSDQMIPVRYLRLAMLATALAISATGCVSDDLQPDPGDPSQLQVLTGWTSGPDRKALYDTLAVLDVAEPGIRVLDESIAGPRELVEQVLTERIANGNSPDSAAVSVGWALWSRADAGELQDLTDLLPDAEIESVFNRDLLALTSLDGGIYGIPTGVQRVNVMWSNAAILRDAGVDAAAPADLDAWLTDLEVVRASGLEYPLAMGDATMQLQLFESVLVADLGGAFYRDLWTHGGTWSTPQISTAIDHFDQLLAYSDPTTRSMPADELVQRVVTGEAAYTVLADSSLPTFEAGPLDRDFRAAPVPGTDGVFDLRADAFVLPTGAGHRDSAISWLEVVASTKGQAAFAAGRGAIPARTGAGAAFVIPYQVDAMWALDHELIVPSLEGGVAASPAWTDRIASAVTRFVRDHRREVLNTELRAAADEALGGGA